MEEKIGYKPFSRLAKKTWDEKLTKAMCIDPRTILFAGDDSEGYGFIFDISPCENSTESDVVC
jgi:hypothetical protein